MECGTLCTAPPQRCPDSRPVIGHLIFFAYSSPDTDRLDACFDDEFSRKLNSTARFIDIITRHNVAA